MGDLPPDLERLGRVLAQATTAAATRHRARVQRRQRLAGSIAAGLLVFAALTPTHLGPADQPDFLPRLTIAPAEASMGCDKPRGQRFHIPEACVVRAPQPQAAR